MLRDFRARGAQRILMLMPFSLADITFDARVRVMRSAADAFFFFFIRYFLSFS